MKVKVEVPHIRCDLVQCHSCQQYGYTKFYCKHHPKYVRCGENHGSDSCSKSKDLPAKLVIRDNVYLANYRECTIHNNLQCICKNHQFKTNSRVIIKNSDTSHMQPNSQLSSGESCLNNAFASHENKPNNIYHLLLLQILKGNTLIKSKLNIQPSRPSIKY